MTVARQSLAEAAQAEQQEGYVQLTEKVGRPATLEGKTYKLKSGNPDVPAMYVTINDIVLNAGTTHEQRRPFEVFINSKNMEHFQWIVALTRVISAVFRKGGDSTFLVEELESVFDPTGGYFKPGEGYIPSLIADLGGIIRQHLESLGMVEPRPRRGQNVVALAAPAAPPPTVATRPRCPKCLAPNSLIKAAGCEQCVCGDYTKCG